MAVTVTRFTPVSKIKNGAKGMAKAAKVFAKINGTNLANDLFVKAVTQTSNLTWTGTTRHTNKNRTFCRVTLYPLNQVSNLGRLNGPETVSVTVGDGTRDEPGINVVPAPTLLDGCYHLGCQGTAGRLVWLTPNEENSLTLVDATTTPVTEWILTVQPATNSGENLYTIQYQVDGEVYYLEWNNGGVQEVGLVNAAGANTTWQIEDFNIKAFKTTGSQPARRFLTGDTSSSSSLGNVSLLASAGANDSSRWNAPPVTTLVFV